MKKIIPVLLLIISSIGLASCANSTPAHSKSFNAGVAWVRNGFPGSNETYCDFSVLSMGANCTKSDSMCDSNAAIFAINDGNYNMQQWLDGCVSVPFKHWPKWLQNYIINLNN